MSGACYSESNEGNASWHVLILCMDKSITILLVCKMEISLNTVVIVVEMKTGELSLFCW